MNSRCDIAMSYWPYLNTTELEFSLKRWSFFSLAFRMKKKIAMQIESQTRGLRVWLLCSDNTLYWQSMTSSFIWSFLWVSQNYLKSHQPPPSFGLLTIKDSPWRWDPPTRMCTQIPFHSHIIPGIPSVWKWGSKVCPPRLFACLSDIIDCGIFWSAGAERRSDRLNLQCQAFQNHFPLMLTAILHL